MEIMRRPGGFEIPLSLMNSLIGIYRRIKELKKRLWNPWTRWPPVGAIDLGDLQRRSPLSREFGYDRGTPVDRYYIEKFLLQNQGDIQGEVLEVGDSHYTRQFGGDRVTRSDVLHVNRRSPEITIVADLASAGPDQIPSNAFDCFIMTQTLQVIYEVRAAIETCYRVLRPGGVLLATFPGISKIAIPSKREKWVDYWRFTRRAAERLFAGVFPPEKLTVQAHGNVLAAVGFLHGLAAEELRQEDLDYHDPDYEVVITVRALKAKVPD